MGIIIGCSAVSSERAGNALNTLIVKPVYRDTIINGKLLGTIGFLASMMTFFIIIHTAAVLVLCGDALMPFIPDYLSRLPFMFLFSMVFTMVFLTLSMLASLLIRDQAFAMILGTLAVCISLNFSYTVSHNLDYIFPNSGLGNLLAGISPYSILWERGAQLSLMDPFMGSCEAFMSVLPEFVTLLLMVIIMTVLSYIVFVRGDIS